jgi:hypothetical protein
MRDSDIADGKNEKNKYRNAFWWISVLSAIMFGVLGFAFENNIWSKWFYILGGIAAFSGHVIWLSGKR